jgi:hypothetical protein
MIDVPTSGIANQRETMLMRRSSYLLWVTGVLLLLASHPAAAITIDTVFVGDPGNASDSITNSPYGGVAYAYRIAKTEVTNAQYAAFLNAKATSDPLGLYNADMATELGGISRSGSPGSYSYATIAGREAMPVNYVGWFDAVRFTNWLSNGQGDGDKETAEQLWPAGSRFVGDSSRS